MDALWNITARISRLFAMLGGVMLLLAALLVTAEVISRKMLTFVYSGSDEMAAYLFAAGTTWSMAHVLVTRGHVRIDALYGYLPLRARAALDVVALLTLGVLAYVLVDTGFNLVFANLTEWNRANTLLRTPLALPQIPWLLGLTLFLISIVVALLRTVVALAKGDYITAGQTAGIASQDEEIADGCRHAHTGDRRVRIFPELSKLLALIERADDGRAVARLHGHHARPFGPNPADALHFREGFPHADQAGSAAGGIKNHVGKVPVELLGQF